MGGGGGGGRAIPNSFGHLLGSPKTLIKLNEIDSIIKMHFSPSCLHYQIMINTIRTVIYVILRAFLKYLKDFHLIFTSNMHFFLIINNKNKRIVRL